MIKLPEILSYDLKIGRVVGINPANNTVDVRIIDKFNHKECYQNAEMFEDYGELIEGVEIRMTTDLFYYTPAEDPPTVEYNARAWSMWLPDFLGQLPLYVNIITSNDPLLPPYIISAFRANYYRQQDMTSRETTRQLSRRLFSTYRIYAKITQSDGNITLFDIESGLSVDCGTDVSGLGIIDEYAISLEGGRDGYFSELYGYYKATLDSTFGFSGWATPTPVPPTGEEAYGAVQTDAYWFDNNDASSRETHTSIPTLGINSTPYGAIAEIGEPSKPFKIEYNGGSVENTSSFYYTNNGTSTISVGGSDISQTTSYEINVISNVFISSAAGIGCFIGGGFYRGERSGSTEVADSDIYTKMIGSAPSLNNGLCNVVNAMNMTSNTVAQIKLAVRPFGFRGLDFGEPVTIIDYL